MEDEGIMLGLRENLRSLFGSIVQRPEKVLIHCAAGIHRTGLCIYTLLRWTGLNPKESMEVLRGINV